MSGQSFPRQGKCPIWYRCTKSDECDMRIALHCSNKRTILAKCRKCGDYPYPPMNDECFECLAFEERTLNAINIIPNRGGE